MRLERSRRSDQGQRLPFRFIFSEMWNHLEILRRETEQGVDIIPATQVQTSPQLLRKLREDPFGQKLGLYKATTLTRSPRWSQLSRQYSGTLQKYLLAVLQHSGPPQSTRKHTAGSRAHAPRTGTAWVLHRLNPGKYVISCRVEIISFAQVPDLPAKPVDKDFSWVSCGSLSQVALLLNLFILQINFLLSISYIRRSMLGHWGRYTTPVFQ